MDDAQRLSVITDDHLEADYRRWWAESYGVPPNRQAVATAVAWGRQLIDSLSAGLSAPDSASHPEDGPHA